MKTYSILALAVMVLCIGTAADARYSGGTGEPNDPYRIATAADLNDIGNHQEDWDKNFILINDVNLAQYTGTHFNIIGNSTANFTGVFDGNDHKVWNFTWNSTGRNGIGLFGYVAGAQIKNLGMEMVDVNAVVGDYVGGLVGTSWTGMITNCYCVGRVSGMISVGGLVGHNDGTIINCYSMVSVNGIDVVGGLAGGNLGTIVSCHSSENSSGLTTIGGLLGSNYGMITNCYSTGRVAGSQSVAGLVASNHGTINNCYSGNEILGNQGVGGLAASNNGGTITNCYSNATVSGYIVVAGLVGGNSGTITASFWDIETSGEPNSAGGTPKTTAQMKTMSTFTDAGWDFVEIWGIGENQTYPFLRTKPAGDSNHDGKVDLSDLAILGLHWLEEK